MNSCIRIKKNLPIDLFNIKENIINIGVTGVAPVFTNSKDYVAGEFRENTYLFNFANNSDFKFDGEFTVCFWAKFSPKNFTDNVFGNKIIVAFNDNSTMSVDIPNTVDVLNNFWVKIERDGADNVSIYIDNVLLLEEVHSGEFNLLDNSYIFIGNQNRYFLGYDVIVDDLLIFESKIDYTDEVPSDYLDLNNFIKLLYIEVSTGRVFGYKEEI